MQETISFHINGNETVLKTDPAQTLLWVLRNHFSMTGTKYGCGSGFCGACTVIIDKEAVRSCSIPISDVAGKNIITIEGLAKDGKLHPVQQAFVDHDAFQCGYCTPGMIMNAVALLMRNPKPSREQIVKGMEDNFCRCGAHIRIIKAIETAAIKIEGGTIL
jgi:aerobic-type carbon monoxide dehydrogenase small subunit (CoxS/CutS family)